MKSMILAASAGIALLAPVAAWGQEPVTTYPNAFFAASQPLNAFDMIQRLPAFTFDSGDSDVRGYSGAAGNVLVDGKRPTSKQEGLAEILRRIPANAVERIELIRAGTSGVDMQGKSVLANVVRVRVTKTQGRVSANASAFRGVGPAGGVAGELSRRSGDTLFEFSALSGRERDDEKGEGPRTRVTPSGAPIRTAIYDEQKADDTTKATAGLETPFAGGKLRLDGSANNQWSHANITEIASFPVSTTEFVRESERLNEFETAGRFERALGPAWSTELVGLVHRSRTRANDRAREGADLTVSGLNSEAGESIGRAVFRRQGEAGVFEFGGEAALNTLSSHSTLTENGASVFLPAANVRVEEKRAEVFASVTRRLSASLGVEAGLRFEGSTLTQRGDSNLEKTLYYPKPRIAATWSANAANQFRFEAERRVGQLDFGDFVSSASLTSNTITAGNPDLEPDKTWRMSLAWEHKIGSDGAIVLTLRQDAIEDVVDRVPVIGPGFAFDAPGNIGSGRRFEASVDAKLPLDRLHIAGGLLKAEATYRKTRVVDPATGQVRVISGESELEGSVEFSQDLQALRLRWGVEGRLARTEREFLFNEVRFDREAASLEAFIEYRPAAQWSVLLEGKNLANGAIYRRRAQYAGPRSTAAVQRIEERAMRFGPWVNLTVQRSF